MNARAGMPADEPRPQGEAGGNEQDEKAQSNPAHSTHETSQAERAHMHPERHDLEWGYYFGAWSH